MVILSRIFIGVIVVSTLLYPAMAQQQDTTQPSAPEFQLEQHNGKVRMRQVFPPAHHTTPITAPQTEATPLRSTEKTQERTIATSEESKWKSEIHATVNPFDSTNILTATMTSSPSGYVDILVYTSQDFGATWQQTLSVANGNDPMFTVDDKGTIYLFYLIPNSFDDIQMYYRYSTDKGKTWKVPAKEKISTGSSNDKEWATADRTNSQYKGAVYLAFLSGDNLVLHTKHSGSTSFSANPVYITSGDFAFVQLVSIDVAPDGALHAAFTGASKNGEKLSLWHTVSTDGGTTFSQPTKITGLAANINEYFDDKFKVPGFKSIPSSVIATNPKDGSLHLIWHDIVVQNNRAVASNVYYTRSLDKGTTWAAQQRLNDNEIVEDYYHYMPSITINANGVVCASWYDGRSAKNSVAINISTLYSLNNGISFVPYIKANEAPANLATLEGLSGLDFTVGHYTQAVCTNGYVIPFWSDGRTGNAFNLYCAFVPITAAATSVERVVRMSQGAATLAIAPNPIANNALITLALNNPTHVQLHITDIMGRIVLTPLYEHCPVGETHVQLAASSLAPGVYFCSVYTNGVLAVSQQITVQR